MRRGGWFPGSRASALDVSAAGASRLPAGTIHAAALGARPAPVDHALAQRLPRAKETYPGVVGSDAGLLGVVLHRDPIHLDPPQGDRVLRLQSLRQARHAATDRVALVGAGLGSLGELAGQRVQGTPAGSLPAVVIDHGVSQHPVE